MKKLEMKEGGAGRTIEPQVIRDLSVVELFQRKQFVDLQKQILVPSLQKLFAIQQNEFRFHYTKMCVCSMNLVFYNQVIGNVSSNFI